MLETTYISDWRVYIVSNIMSSITYLFPIKVCFIYFPLFCLFFLSKCMSFGFQMRDDL
jgi:hypothetical protein